MSIEVHDEGALLAVTLTIVEPHVQILTITTKTRFPKPLVSASGVRWHFAYEDGSTVDFPVPDLGGGRGNVAGKIESTKYGTTVVFYPEIKDDSATEWLWTNEEQT